jgi:rhodanese-related sulfurtransferase
MSFLSNLFKTAPAVNYKSLVEAGAIVLDVRSQGEFQSGHIKGSINIPVNRLTDNLNKIPQNKVIITCCASGSRSGVARSILIAKGFKDVYNAGSWTKLR